MFDSNMVSVDFRNGITDKGPIEGRKYTLTHKDDTGELFLTVALAYAYDKINPLLRDEVFGLWKRVDNRFILKIYLYVDGNKGIEEAKKRNEIFRKELPLALNSIVYGDKNFIEKNPNLLKSLIIVRFISAYEELNGVCQYGKIEDFYNDRIEKKEDIYEEESILNDRDPLVNGLILTLLNPYIKEEIIKLYKEEVYYCLNEAEVLEVYKEKENTNCEFNYVIYIGLKVGENPPPYNNFIIEFLVTPNSVQALSVKNPR